MRLVKTLLNLFRKQRHTTLNVTSFTFVGEPGGQVDVLKSVLKEALKHDQGLKRAYLTLIRHAGDERVRIALCIDTDSAPHDVIRPLSDHCAQHISSIDIMFFSDLAQHHIDQLKSVVEPFHAASGL